MPRTVWLTVVTAVLALAALERPAMAQRLGTGCSPSGRISRSTVGVEPLMMCVNGVWQPAGGGLTLPQRLALDGLMARPAEGTACSSGSTISTSSAGTVLQCDGGVWRQVNR